MSGHRFQTAQAAVAHGAGLPLARHRSARVVCLFRRPFFAGDVCAVQGRLLLGAGGTRLLGGIYRRLPDGALEAQPSIGTRLEGVLEPEGRDGACPIASNAGTPCSRPAPPGAARPRRQA